MDAPQTAARLYLEEDVWTRLSQPLRVYAADDDQGKTARMVLDNASSSGSHSVDSGHADRVDEIHRSFLIRQNEREEARQQRMGRE